MATRIKRYEIEAERLEELLLRIETEMGPGALVETREFKRGALLGFIGGTRFVEAIATLELEGIEAVADDGSGLLPPLADATPQPAVAAEDVDLEAQSIRAAEPEPQAADSAAPRHGDEARATAYQPPIAVRSAEQQMPVALDEVDSLAYALGKLREHSGNVEDFFAQDAGGSNISRAAVQRAQAVHGLDVEAELAALEAAGAQRPLQPPAAGGATDSNAAVVSAGPLSAEERYLAAQAMMGSGLSDLPLEALESFEAEPAADAVPLDEELAAEVEPETQLRDDAEAEPMEWAADEPAEPVIELHDEFSLEEIRDEDEDFDPAATFEESPEPEESSSLDAEFEDEELLASGAGLAMDLARDIEAPLAHEPEPVPMTAVEPEPAAELPFSAEAVPPAFEAPQETAVLETAAAADAPRPVTITTDVLAPPAPAAAAAPLAAIPLEVLRFMEEMKQSMNGLQAKVQELADVKSQVADVAAQAASQAAQAAIERLLAEEARRRTEDDQRRREDQQRYEEEIAALRAAADRMSAAAERSTAEPAAAATANPLQLDVALSYNAVQRQVYDMLLDWNIGHYDALELLNIAIAAIEPGGQPSFDGLITSVSEEICRNVLLGDGIRLNRTPPGKAVALVGPTGVGKTTTIAKLAAHFAFQQGKRVSLISMDNYRIAAAEQLRTYADIMGLDLDIVFSKDEFDKVLSRRRSSDLILIDTAGRSPNNAKHLQELREIFTVHPPDEVHLVLNAGTRRDDMKLILEAFKPLSYDHLIVSKLDETRSLGALYNLTRACTLPISYFAVGQSVPEDIRTATLPFIKQWIAQGRIL